MYSTSSIKKLFGVRELERIKARHRGGLSGQKGTKFEDLFAIYKLAEELALCYETVNEAFKNRRRAVVKSQIFAFIDDIAVETKAPQFVRYYQLRNVSTLAWGKGKFSLARLFLLQKKLCTSAKGRWKLYLVVPTQRLRKKLQSTTPSNVAKCSSILVFPYHQLSVLVQTHNAFRNALIKLSPFNEDNVENEKLLTLARFLCGHWFDATNHLSTQELARAIDNEPGAFLRPMKGSRQMPAIVKKVLSSIPQFKWTLSKGFLFWNYGITDSGRYPHHCWTREFDQLILRIKKTRPTTFDTIEGELR